MVKMRLWKHFCKLYWISRGAEHCPLPKTNIEATGPDQRTPLIQAAKGGHLKTVELLINYSVNFDARDERNRTALAWAIQELHWNVADFLLPLCVTYFPKKEKYFRCDYILFMASKRGDEF